MRSTLFAVLLALLCLPLGAAEKKGPKPEPIPEKADDIVAEMDQLLTEEPQGEPSGKKALQAMWKARLVRVDALIAAFRKKYPDHPQRWDVLYWEANSNGVRTEMGLPKLAGVKPTPEVYAEVAAAADASPEMKVRASFDRVNLLSEQVLDKKMPLPDWEQTLADHVAKFPEYGGNHILLEQRANFIRKYDLPRLIPMLEELTKSANSDIADMAKRQLATAKTRDALKTKPLELKFKAAGGNDIDLEKLRGKVVLLVFWAGWSEGSMADIPKFQQVQAKYAEKGLEVLGINVDDSEKDFKAAVKKRKITWPNYFDGKGWENPFTKPYGIDDVPTLWLVNKQGLVADFDATTELPAKVEKLLAE